jgi:hypothetical protein
MRVSKKDREESLLELRAAMPKGTTVYCILRHVSKSGMCRDISPIVFLGGDADSPRYYSFHVANVLGWRAVSGGHDAVRVVGGGMDMGFHLVSSLAVAIYGDGYALKHHWL